MYMPSKMFANTRFSENVFITEYFPISRRTQHGVMIPTYSNGEISVLFKDLIPKYNLGNQCVTNQPNQEPLLTFEQYQAELMGLLDRMNNMHQGQISFRVKDINTMYETYRAIHGKKWLAGLISIVRDEIMNNVRDNLAVPPEAIPITVGFETFVAGLKRNLPMLTLDYYTASNMYQMYIENHTLPGGQATDIPFLIGCPNNQALSQVIGAAAPNISADIIVAVVMNGTMSDDILAQYYDNMQKRYGIRERIANALLMYHPTIIERTLNGQKNSLGIISDREIVWSRTVQAPTVIDTMNQTGAGDLF